MISPEQLAEYVSQSSGESIQSEQVKGENYMVPPPPKPGEVIICQLCGKPMYPKDFSRDEKIRKYEFKWHIHYQCQLDIFDEVDNVRDFTLAQKSMLGGHPVKIENRDE